MYSKFIYTFIPYRKKNLSNRKKNLQKMDKVLWIKKE